jgi:hypothetical protein
MNDCISLDFLGKRCKNNSHNLCDGQWKGLGLEICCNCYCHNKTILEKYIRANPTSTEKTDIVKNSEEIGEFSK